MKEIELGMTNCDLSIDDGFADALKSAPNKVFGRHSAWEFNGQVWFADNKFHEEVWRYGTIIATYSENSLEELMETVNSNHGLD